MPQEHSLPPKDIPDLSSLPPQSEVAGLLRTLGGGGSRDYFAYVLHVNLIRLLDASIRDYELGRAAVSAFHARQPHQFGLLPIIDATTHFESCIWHFERFIKHAKAIRSCTGAEPELKALIPKSSGFLTGLVEGRVTRLRHALAHLETEGASGRIQRGSSLALLPQQQGLVIGEHAIEWSELVAWLTEAHTCASAIARFKPLGVSPRA